MKYLSGINTSSIKKAKQEWLLTFENKIQTHKRLKRSLFSMTARQNNNITNNYRQRYAQRHVLSDLALCVQHMKHALAYGTVSTRRDRFSLTPWHSTMYIQQGDWNTLGQKGCKSLSGRPLPCAKHALFVFVISTKAAVQAPDVGQQFSFLTVRDCITPTAESRAMSQGKIACCVPVVLTVTQASLPVLSNRYRHTRD